MANVVHVPCSAALIGCDDAQSLLASTAGEAHAVVLWWQLDMDGTGETTKQVGARKAACGAILATA